MVKKNILKLTLLPILLGVVVLPITLSTTSCLGIGISFHMSDDWKYMDSNYTSSDADWGGTCQLRNYALMDVESGIKSTGYEGVWADNFIFNGKWANTDAYNEETLSNYFHYYVGGKKLYCWFGPQNGYGNSYSATFSTKQIANDNIWWLPAPKNSHDQFDASANGACTIHWETMLNIKQAVRLMFSCSHDEYVHSNGASLYRRCYYIRFSGISTVW